MANSLLTYGNKKSNSSTALLSKYAPIATQYQPATATKESDEEKNKGGFFGGLGYTLGKLGTGVFSILEGAWDFTAGGIADLLGADEWAEEQFANNIAGGWSQSLDEWYNPSKGMQVVGDVASGIGNSLVGIGVAAGASLISGGTLAPAALSWLAAGTMGLGAAGGATSEAYAKTGKLGGKEYLYGALSGGTEMVLEKVSGGIESTLAKSFAKDTAKTLTKKSVVSGIVKNFASEAFEEGVSEIITPYYQRFTGVDPDAKNATAKQVGYAALVGGLSGALMGGVGDGIGAIRATSRGNTISQNPEQVDAILGMAREFAEYEAEHGTGNENYQYVAQLISEYEAKDNGTGTLTVAQKRALGHLERAVVKCAYQPMVESSKQQIIANADAFVEAINARNYPDGKGGVLHFNSGADFVANEAMLTSFAVQDALGKLLLSADSVYDLAMNKRGEGMLQADFRNFQKNATAESKAGINEAFGVDIDSIAYEDFMEKLSTTNRSVLEERKAGMYARATSKKLITNALRAGTEINAFDKKADMPEGTNLYKAKDGKLFTVTKTAEGYYLYLDGKITVKLDKKQLLQAINELNGVKPKAKKKATTTQTAAAPAPVAPAETRVEQQVENAEPVAAAQTEENAPVAEEVAAADNTAVETTTQTEERAEAPVEQEQEADNTETVAETPVETPQTSETATDNENGQAELQTRKKTAKKKPATVSNTESVAKTKAPTKATARRKLIRLVMKKSTRESVRGTAVKDGKQYVCDGFFAARYTEILEKTVEKENYPFDIVDNVIKTYQNENDSERISVDTDKLRELNTEKADFLPCKLGGTCFDIRRLSPLIDSIQNPTVYLKPQAQVHPAAYIKGDNGEAVLLPLRVDGSERVLYEADYDSETTRKEKAERDARLKKQQERESAEREKRLQKEMEERAAADAEREKERVADKNKNIEKLETVGKTLLAGEKLKNDSITVYQDDADMRGKETCAIVALLDKYGVSVPIKTRGWIIQNLRTVQKIDDGNSTWRIEIKKGANASKSIWGVMDKLYAAMADGTKTGEPSGVRYAISIGNEQVGVDVEQGKNLVALHNLSADKLQRVIDLGGFPMPSIAVTTTELAHNDYGDITVIFGKETIDPESDSRNVVYDRDAWTPTTPSVDVKLNEQKVDNLVADLRGAVGEKSVFAGGIRRFFESNYKDNNGDYIIPDHDYHRNILGQKAIGYNGIVAAYLTEKGVSVEPVYAERGFNMGWRSYSRQEATALFDSVGITKDITRDNATQEQRKQILEKYIEYEANRRSRFLKKKNPDITQAEIIEHFKGDYDDGHVSQLFFMAEDFFNENRPKDVYDDYATLDKMTAQITDKEDFYSWFWDKIEATFEKKGIDNDGDIFDRYGNRKSFEQTHYRYTVENIVKAMAKGDQEGKNNLGMTAGALAAKLSKQFESIEDIRAAKQYLSLVSEEDLTAFNERTYTLYDELVTEIAGKSTDIFSSQTRRDDVGDILGKCAAVKPLTVENIKRKFASETRGYDLNYKFDDKIANKALAFFETLKHIPTTYFEAKPRRAVGFDEIKKVLLPSGTSEQLLQSLDEKNIPYITYDNTQENARADIIKGLNGVRFAVAENETTVPAGNKSQNLPPLQMKRAESYARQKVKGYDDLSAAQKLEVEWTIASGWRNGVEESQILTLARLSAQAKIGIGFADLTATDKNGNSVSIDAACYSRGGHLTVYLNPKSKRTVEVATLHELTHAMEGMEGYAELQAMAEEYYKAHPDEKAKIDNAYRNLYKNEQAKYTEEILPAELTAHYVETMLEKRNILAEMTTEKPPFMKRCINWLKKRVSALKGVDNAAAQEVERLAKKWESTFNLNKGKIAGNGANTRYAAGREIKKYNPTTEEVAQNTETVSKMKTVAVLKGDEFRLEGGAIVKAVAAYYNSLGNSVYSNELGDVELTKRGVKDSFAHGIGERKAAAYHAVPEIIKSGKVVDYQQNWKDRGYDTAIIAAPISISGEEYYAAVVVRRTQSTQRFYLHEIDIEKRSAVLTEATAANSTQELGGSPFINSIFQKIRNVNTFSQNSTGNFRDGTQKRYALSPEAQRAYDESVQKTLTALPNDRVTFKDVITKKQPVGALTEQMKGDGREFTEGWRIATTNAQAGVERVLRETGTQRADAITNYVRAGKNAAASALTTAQYSLDGETYLGESWEKIWKPIYAMDKKDGRAYGEFNRYLLHYHNIDRMAVGKPVYGDSVTAENSKEIVAEIERHYPTFKKQAEKVWKFLDNMLTIREEGGLYSAEYVRTLREMYPHYVPTIRAESKKNIATIQGKGNLRVNPNKKKATGGDTDVLAIDEMVAEQVMQAIPAARVNTLLLQMANGAEHSEFTIIGGESVAADIDADTLITTHQDKAKGQYQITFWQDGKSMTAEVSPNVYKGIEAFMPSGETVFNNFIVRGVSKLTSFFKKTVTAWNPFFTFYKNPIRDIQTALNYTRYGWTTFTKNLKRAKSEISSNGRYWQEAQAAGILSASIYDYEKGLQYKASNKSTFKRGTEKITSALENASNAIEMAPRLAEYICAREAGLSVQEALLQAQDLTTNFGRSGTFVKKLNATCMPFLNPAVQGFSKMVRAYTGKDAAKSWVNLIIRSIVLGIGATALNDLLNDDDEEYQNLSDYVKENNYVLALGDGDFLKIPKGRENGFIGMLWLRVRRAKAGDEKAFDGIVDSFISTLTPTDNFTRNIFSPFLDMQTNTTWYGGAIESSKWDGVRPQNRYDESTSSISIWLGKMFNYSPIKIDYLLEQYGGIFADVFLPMTTLQAESNPLTGNILTNSTTNSKWSGKFYEAIEEYTYQKNEGSAQSQAALRYLNSVKKTVNNMLSQKREIQADKTLTNSEKLKQVKVIQAAINALEQSALEQAELIYTEIGKYDGTNQGYDLESIAGAVAIGGTDMPVSAYGNLADEDYFEAAYLNTVATVVGERYAFETYSKKAYQKAVKITDSTGIDFGIYYDYYFTIKNLEADIDKDGEKIAGSRKEKIIREVANIEGITKVQKLLLIMCSGYTIADGDIRGISGKRAKKAVAQYIVGLNISKAEKVELAEACGLKVKNGKILIN